MRTSTRWLIAGGLTGVMLTAVALEQLSYLKLKEKYQDMNPFKFILYSGRIGNATPPMGQGEQSK